MQFTEQTSTVLKLQAEDNDYPSRWVVMLMGIFFFLSGLGFMITLGRLVELKCKRVEPTQVACELISSNLLGKHTTPIPTGQLQGAEVDKTSDSEETFYRVELLTKNGRVPLTEMYFGSGRQYEQADQINAFVSNPQQMSLKIQQRHSWLAYPFGGLFAFVGGCITFGCMIRKFQTSCIFDKGSHRMYLKQHNVFKSEVIEHMIHEIKEAQVVEGTDSDGDKTYSTSLVLHSGEPIPLQIDGSGAEHYKIAQSINHFLGVR